MRLLTFICRLLRSVCCFASKAKLRFAFVCKVCKCAGNSLPGSRIFLQILVFLSFFGLSLYLQVVMVNHFGIISGAKFFLGSVFYSVLL